MNKNENLSKVDWSKYTPDLIELTDKNFEKKVAA
jgi:hypothetical protein